MSALFGDARRLDRATFGAGLALWLSLAAAIVAVPFGVSWVEGPADYTTGLWFRVLVLCGVVLLLWLVPLGRLLLKRARDAGHPELVFPFFLALLAIPSGAVAISLVAAAAILVVIASLPSREAR